MVGFIEGISIKRPGIFFSRHSAREYEGTEWGFFFAQYCFGKGDTWIREEGTPCGPYLQEQSYVIVFRYKCILVKVPVRTKKLLNNTKHRNNTENQYNYNERGR